MVFKSRLLLLMACLLLILMMEKASAVSCPCEYYNFTLDESIQNSTVSWDDFLYTCCNFSEECAEPKGPNEVCGGPRGYIGADFMGACQRGTICAFTIRTGTTFTEYRNATGRCMINEDFGKGPQRPPSLTVSPSPSPDPPTPRAPVKCRVPCNIDFCSGGRNKFCSANESAFARVLEREPCQHTTCWACRLLVSPDCPKCPEPVRKRCLRHFSLCLIRYYASDDIFLKLTDPRASTRNGTIICHVSDVSPPSLPENSSESPNNDEDDDNDYEEEE